MSEEAPENQDRGLFGLFGKKKEEKEGTNDDQIKYPPGTQTHNQPQSQAAPQHGVQHGQGQLNPEEAEQKKQTGFLGKLHPAKGSGSGSGSSSSSGEEEEGKKKERGRKKKGVKEKLPGDYNSSDQYGDEGVKKEGLLDKIKDKIPGHRNTNE